VIIKTQPIIFWSLELQKASPSGMLLTQPPPRRDRGYQPGEDEQHRAASLPAHSPRSLPAGSLVPTAYASITSDIPGEIIASAVAVALPEKPDYPGLIMEYSAGAKGRD